MISHYLSNLSGDQEMNDALFPRAGSPTQIQEKEKEIKFLSENS